MPYPSTGRTTVGNSSYTGPAITIQIQTFEDGEVIQRDAKAYQTVEPGLVVQRDSARGGKWLPTWAVTHRASGYRLVGGFRSLHAAREYAAEVAGVTDWTEDRETLLAQAEELAPKLRLMAQRFKGRSVA